MFLSLSDFACGTGGFLTSWLKGLAPQIQTPEDQKTYNDSTYGVEKKPFPYQLCITNMLLHDIDEPHITYGNSLMKDVLDYTDRDRFDVILMIIWSQLTQRQSGSPFEAWMAHTKIA